MRRGPGGHRPGGVRHVPLPGALHPRSAAAARTRSCVTPSTPTAARARLLAVIDEGVAEAHPTMVADVQAYCAAHDDVLELPAPPIVVPGGEAIKNQRRPGRRDPRRDQRARRRPALLRRRDRRRRGARHGRLRGRDRAPRRAADPRADHRAGAGRLGGRRQERHQRVRQEELRRLVRAAARGAQRLRPARSRCATATGAPASRRRSRSRCSRTPRSSPGSSTTRTTCASARCRAMASPGAPQRRAAPAPHRHAAATRSSSARRGRWTSATGRRTSSSSSRTTSCATARRWRSASRSTRPTATSPAACPHADWRRIIELFEARRPADLAPPTLATPGRGGRPRGARRAGRVPRAPGRAADDHAARAASARASKCTSWTRRCCWRPPTSCVAESKEEERDGWQSTPALAR